ncbi:flavodoxin family protein [Bacillus haynesii]|uniref:flavodoxin family protein n=1 Tax=Bacillus haynesii TaxID=1925021 RepID=UPI002DB8CF37|nr:flavodoxin family protein [Bacillus haynesii]MEC1447734.1 flavodoxin family protein [Bacillus haynesii]MEC1563239.1 flavodoxin family protein [Bacillus haynesii]
MGIAAICGSSRENGNTEELVNRLVDGLDADKIYLRNYHVEPVSDYRHGNTAPFYPDDDYRNLISRVLEKDILIFSTPIYWYGMSGLMKNFIDSWSQTLMEHGRSAFKQEMAKKTVYVAAVGDDDPRLKGLPLIQQFQYIFDIMNMTFDGYLLGKGNKPGGVMTDRAAIVAANELRRKLTESETGRKA